MFNRRTLHAFGLTFFLLAAAVTPSKVGVVRAADSLAVVEGHGVSVQNGAVKYFSFSARQTVSTAAVSRPASGYVKMRQFSDVWGYFSLRGQVTCVSVFGNFAVIGTTILNGDGTATGQVGKRFRVFVIDGEVTNDPDQLDNSVIPDTATDCSQQPAPWPAGGTVLEDGEISVSS